MLQICGMEKTMEVFFINPTKEHYLIDISRNTGLAHTSIKINLTKLLKLGLIREDIQKRGKRKFPIYKANINSNRFKQHKIIYNLSRLFESGLIEFLESKFTPNAIVVFGSYRRGEDVEESDIDLFVEAAESNVDTRIFEKKLKRKIQIHFNERFTNYPKELRNNIINGIVVHGFLEAYK